jgi:SRSO17 transposase
MRKACDGDRDWWAELRRWLQPFVARLPRREQRRWAPVYLSGLLLPGERKSVAPMAHRVAPGDVQQLHHFVAAAPWATAPLEEVLAQEAERLVGGPAAVLVVDDTALVKKGVHSAGVAHQYCGQLGKQANCQALVSVTLAHKEVPICLALRLFLPEDWATDAARRARAGVPEELAFRPKWQIALDEIDRLRAAGVTFGCVLADADYGRVIEFRHGLSARGLRWAVGILSTHKAFPAEVALVPPMGRQRRPHPTLPSRHAAALIAELGAAAFRRIAWRCGTKGVLSAAFAAVRVRVADGAWVRGTQHLPSAEEVWLVCEERASGERKYYLTNHPADTPLETLAAAIKARWVCEQAHQQMKEELGLDHFEGRSWRGLHHHAVLTMIALAFLQHLRLDAEKKPRPPNRRPGHRPSLLSRRCGAASSPCSPASPCDVRIAASAAAIIDRPRLGRVVLEWVAIR